MGLTDSKVRTILILFCSGFFFLSSQIIYLLIFFLVGVVGMRLIGHHGPVAEN